MHDPKCGWPRGEACLRFSTDGTRLGAEIAHSMNLDREGEIAALVQWQHEQDKRERLTGMPEEQADWEQCCATPRLEPGNLQWDFICGECGQGSMMPDFKD